MSVTQVPSGHGREVLPHDDGQSIGNGTQVSSAHLYSSHRGHSEIVLTHKLEEGHLIVSIQESYRTGSWRGHP